MAFVNKHNVLRLPCAKHCDGTRSRPASTLTGRDLLQDAQSSQSPGINENSLVRTTLSDCFHTLYTLSKRSAPGRVVCAIRVKGTAAEDSDRSVSKVPPVVLNFADIDAP